MNSNYQNPNTIQSLDDLVTVLSEAERTKFGHIINTLQLPISAFDPCCSWSTECYTRNCIIAYENFELILLCWEAGQFAPIHDHGGEECWVKVIQSEFRETIYKIDESGELNAVKTTISHTGDISYMIDFMGYHRLENLNNQRGMSLHLYAKPIRNCQLFDEDSKTFFRKNLAYTTVPKLKANLK